MRWFLIAYVAIGMILSFQFANAQSKVQQKMDGTDISARADHDL